MDNNELYHHGVKGMKWGIRRYQNRDGSLTFKGKKRYNRELADVKVSERKNIDANPKKWVREDIQRTKKLTESGTQMTRSIRELNQVTIKNRTKPKMDLSNKTDKELRDEINRAFLEKQYNDLLAPQKEAKGREYANKVLETAGSVLAVGSSALGIALAIKELRG